MAREHILKCLEAARMAPSACNSQPWKFVVVDDRTKLIQMSDAADLSICVIGKEGCCGALLMHCDVVVTSIDDALDLLLKTGRLRATLRT